MPDWGEGWEESDKNRYQRMKRKTYKKLKKAEWKGRKWDRTELKPQTRVQIRSSGSNTGLLIKRSRCVCLSVCFGVQAGVEATGSLIIAPLPEMNLRWGRVNGFISSKTWPPPPPQVDPRVFWKVKPSVAVLLGGGEVLMDTSSWQGRCSTFCISFLQPVTHLLSASIGQQVTWLWALLTAWTQFKNGFVVSFPPSHKHTFACVAVFTWSSPL